MPTNDDFNQKHILNPNTNRGYESWNKRQQNDFLRNKLSAFGGGNPNQTYGRKNMNSVIIATSQEILEDFRRPGVKFEPQQDFYWSNRRYNIWLYKKSSNPSSGPDEQYSVTKLNEKHGPMHFLARTTPLDQFKPIHFHAQSPTPDPYSFPRFTNSEEFLKEIQLLQQSSSIPPGPAKSYSLTLSFSSSSSSLTPRSWKVYLLRFLNYYVVRPIRSLKSRINRIFLKLT